MSVAAELAFSVRRFRQAQAAKPEGSLMLCDIVGVAVHLPSGASDVAFLT